MQGCIAAKRAGDSGEGVVSLRGIQKRARSLQSRIAGFMFEVTSQPEKGP